MSGSGPLVSVLIPTINRPQLVVDALQSALQQTVRDIEVIVVVDGPDDMTLAALHRIDDCRLRILPLPEGVGVGGARNAALDAARGPWIALLDDDDAWLPRKLEMQLETARRSRYTYPIVSCRFIARTERGDVVLPRRFPRLAEPLSEYLFCQTRLLGGEGLVLPSTVLARAELFRRTRFRYRHGAHEGSDWLLRAVCLDSAGVEFVATAEPLALWRGEEARSRMSNTGEWRTLLSWAREHSDLLTPRACAGFILIRASLAARKAREGRAFWVLLWEAFRRGRPTVIGVLAHTVIWVVPRRMRFAMAAVVSRWWT